MNYNIADDEWEWYVGKLFSKLIKDNLKDIKTVVELAPGFRYKIAYALKDVNFNGTIYIIDSDNNVINFVKEKYKEILPDCNIICINKTFENSIEYLPKKINLFLSNHSIDDLLIFQNLDNTTSDLKKSIMEAWKEIITNQNNYYQKSNNVYNTFLKLKKEKEIDFIIMSQYKSNIFLEAINDNIYNYINDTFQKIKLLTNSNDKIINNSIAKYFPFGEDEERYNYKELLDNMQNAKHWICGKFR